MSDAGIFSTVGPMPEDFDRTNPPPSGFVDEPDVYEEAHVEGRESTSAVVIVDPVKDEVVGVMDLQVLEHPYNDAVSVLDLYKKDEVDE